MTSSAPFKSVTAIGVVGDTSLALPSANQPRSGQQRVLDQVLTVRRSRSRLPSRSGSSSTSPTSPFSDSVFTESLLSPTGTLNGSVFFGNGPSRLQSLEKNVTWKAVNGLKGSAGNVLSAPSSFTKERNYGLMRSKSVGQAINSRSEPDLVRQLSGVKGGGVPKRIVSERTSYRKSYSEHLGTIMPKAQPRHPPQPQLHLQLHPQPKPQLHPQPKPQPKLQPKPQPPLASKPTTKAAPKTNGEAKLNGHSGGADITMKEAVEYLSKEDETYQHCGASFIQHNTFLDEKAKQEVRALNGIPPLVALLRRPSEQVRLTASAALRNLSFKDNNNKQDIQRHGGIGGAVELLAQSDSAEMQKQLTGLLWNLSSLDSLKPDLLKSALPVLMDRVVLPHTTASDSTSAHGGDAEVFFNATGCLRNLSSAKQSNRQAMRKCRGLVDSLVSYVNGCVDAEKPDDKSVENCVCILHNLTFQLEAEAPALFSRIRALAVPAVRNQNPGNSGPIGCFSQQGKAADQESHFDFPVVEEPHPTGASRLIHSKTLQTYLALLGSSQCEETLEACCGTMQNLTAHPGITSSVMTHTIVQKLGGLRVIAPLLKSSRVNLQRSAVVLVGNLAKNSRLHSVIARKVLPELLGILKAGTEEGNESDDILAMACQTACSLLLRDPDLGKAMLTDKLVTSLNDLSQNRYFPKSSKAAALFLHNLWSDKAVQSHLRKQGMNKTSFINDVTMAAHKSVQVVD